MFLIFSKCTLFNTALSAAAQYGPPSCKNRCTLLYNIRYVPEFDRGKQVQDRIFRYRNMLYSLKNI